MKYLVLSVFIAVVAARPEPPAPVYGPPSGAVQPPPIQAPSSSYGPPSGPASGPIPVPVAAPTLNPGQTYLLSPLGGSGGASFSSGGAGGYSGGGGGGSSYSGVSSYHAPASGYHSGGGQSFHSSAPSFHSAGASYHGGGGGGGGGQSYHGHGQGQTFGSAISSSFAAPAQQAPATIVQKHIYVHVPPPEAEEQFNSPAIAHQQARQKHYKIIFIKAPSSGGQQFNSPSLYAPPPEEKTLVYVLVKKNEPQLDLASPAIAHQHVPSKPEVYFIKYKNTAKQIDGGAGFSSGGGGGGGHHGGGGGAVAGYSSGGADFSSGGGSGGYADVDPRGGATIAVSGATAAGTSAGY